MIKRLSDSTIDLDVAMCILTDQSITSIPQRLQYDLAKGRTAESVRDRPQESWPKAAPRSLHDFAEQRI